ncbi:MAG: M48 family peptidase [Hyphomicrobiales bacterium]|nr:MAG: M48 family peptidase [Hyphomicrobiales bacterium]
MPAGKKTATSVSKTVALQVEGIGVPVEVRRHHAARRFTLRVSKTRRAVVVTMPTRARVDDAGVFLNKHIDWVRERLGNVPDGVPFAPGQTIPVRGKPHRVAVVAAERGAPIVKADANAAVPRLLVAGRVEHVPRRLRDWLYEEAKRDLDERVSFHAKALGVRARRICLRDQQTRWGSCSATGVLSFSWRLILAPPFVLDYVAAHEVAHILEMNHGPRFWRLVAKCVPRLEEAKAWLRNEGSDLHRYGLT